MVIPYKLLDTETLNALIEEFTTRSGAVHGHAETSLEEKIRSVHERLKNGEAEIQYDEQSQSWTIVLK